VPGVTRNSLLCDLTSISTISRTSSPSATQKGGVKHTTLLVIMATTPPLVDAYACDDVLVTTEFVRCCSIAESHSQANSETKCDDCGANNSEDSVGDIIFYDESYIVNNSRPMSDTEFEQLFGRKTLYFFHDRSTHQPYKKYVLTREVATEFGVSPTHYVLASIAGLVIVPDEQPTLIPGGETTTTTQTSAAMFSGAIAQVSKPSEVEILLSELRIVSIPVAKPLVEYKGFQLLNLPNGVEKAYSYALELAGVLSFVRTNIQNIETRKYRDKAHSALLRMSSIPGSMIVEEMPRSQIIVSFDEAGTFYVSMRTPRNVDDFHSKGRLKIMLLGALAEAIVHNWSADKVDEFQLKEHDDTYQLMRDFMRLYGRYTSTLFGEPLPESAVAVEAGPNGARSMIYHCVKNMLHIDGPARGIAPPVIRPVIVKQTYREKRPAAEEITEQTAKRSKQIVPPTRDVPTTTTTTTVTETPQPRTAERPIYDPAWIQVRPRAPKKQPEAVSRVPLLKVPSLHLIEPPAVTPMRRGDVESVSKQEKVQQPEPFGRPLPRTTTTTIPQREEEEEEEEETQSFAHSLKFRLLDWPSEEKTPQKSTATTTTTTQTTPATRQMIREPQQPPKPTPTAPQSEKEQGGKHAPMPLSEENIIFNIIEIQTEPLLPPPPPHSPMLSQDSPPASPQQQHSGGATETHRTSPARDVVVSLLLQ
jgi:hypothetical protein